jgi:DNA-binding NarL/FixJ family response regulator
LRARVLLGDDHALVAEALRRILEPEFDVVAVAADGSAVVREAVRLKPDAVLIDISMPLVNGLEAARRIKRAIPETKILFLTMHLDLSYVRDAMKLGASGYLLKRAAGNELVSALHAILRGRTYIAPELLAAIKDPSLQKAMASGRVPALTERQREILGLIASGKSNKEIAAILRVTDGTVRFHRTTIGRKLGISTTAELARYAIEHCIVKG